MWFVWIFKVDGWSTGLEERLVDWIPVASSPSEGLAKYITDSLNHRFMGAPPAQKHWGAGYTGWFAAYTNGLVKPSI